MSSCLLSLGLFCLSFFSGRNIEYSLHLFSIPQTFNRVTVLLSLLFNACVIHGFLPVGLMETVIVPIIKSARENISSKDNYRSIALTNTLSKIIEKLILARCSSLLQTTEN